MKGTIAAAAFALIAVTSALLGAQRAQGPLFRANSDAVWVNVSVREGRSTVDGLQSSDFALTDRGVAQKAEIVSSDSVPIDVTLLVDTSRSVVNSLPLFRAEVEAIVGLLQPNEQIRLITFDTRGASDPADAGAVARARRFTSFSWARRRRSRTHSCWRWRGRCAPTGAISCSCSPTATTRRACWDTARLPNWPATPNRSYTSRSSSRPGPNCLHEARSRLLRAAATRTGGSMYPPTQNEGGIVAAFQRAIDDFRHSYVLFFTPNDVPGAGWHELSVKVLKRGDFDVRARAGYFGR